MSPTSDGKWVVPLGAGPWLAAVADGMGGHQAGELASETAILELISLADGMTSEQSANSVLERVNQKVFEAMFSPRGRSGMGCTVAGVSFRAGALIVFNLGDSRVYLLRGSQLQQCSVDHVLGSGRPSLPRSHTLTQSLGGLARRMPIKPHVHHIRVEDGDGIVLCSDGLTDMLQDDEIAEVLARRPEHPARALVDAALDAGGRDNVTVIVVPGTVR